MIDSLSVSATEFTNRMPPTPVPLRPLTGAVMRAVMSASSGRGGRDGHRGGLAAVHAGAGPRAHGPRGDPARSAPRGDLPAGARPPGLAAHARGGRAVQP